MVKKLKRFWDSFGDKGFLGKLVLPSGAIFFTLGTIAQYYCYNLDKDDLVRTTGTIENINEIIEYGGRGNRYHPLMIYLTGQESPFRIKDDFKKRFETLRQQMSSGDNVIVYTRTGLQTFLGWGKQNDIFQIEKNGVILFDLEWMKKYKKSQLDSFAFGAVICWALYGLFRYNKYSEKKAAANKVHVP